MKTKITLDSQFVALALISTMIIVGIFAATKFEETSGYAVKAEKTTVWHCGYYNKSYDPKGSWRWVRMPDADMRLEKKITAKDAGCLRGKWTCAYDTCGEGKRVGDCFCIE